MRLIRNENLDSKLVAFYHDEINTDTVAQDAERVSEILEYALGDFITEKYKLNVQMGGSAKTGDNWFDVH
jgi:DNA polymerase I-like protein with 3'-5' exonuclease and polymerase domains